MRTAACACRNTPLINAYIGSFDNFSPRKTCKDHVDLTSRPAGPPIHSAAESPGMNKLRAALKTLERIVFLPPAPSRGLRLIECQSEIRVHGTRRGARKHLALVCTGRGGE
jgi:hypothetical protein